MGIDEVILSRSFDLLDGTGSCKSIVHIMTHSRNLMEWAVANSTPLLQLNFKHSCCPVLFVFFFGEGREGGWERGVVWSLYYIMWF